jgi:hypothetical protein
MQIFSRSTLHIASFAACAAAGFAACAAPASAQAYGYPSMQLPTVSERDYTAAITAANGTSLLFQWRERASSVSHLQLDAGIGDPAGSSNLVLFIGGGYGRQLARATDAQPLDVLLTAGAGAAFGDGFTLLRVPLGVSVGHRFELENDFALTPYVHPRLSLDVCGSCKRSTSSEVSLNFDVGTNFEVTPNFALRLAASFSGSELAGRSNAVALGVTWTPLGLRK